MKTHHISSFLFFIKAYHKSKRFYNVFSKPGGKIMTKISENNNAFIRYDEMITLAKTQGLGIDELAKRIGVSTPTLLGWRKRSPKASHLAAVADLLDISVDYLLGRTELMNTTQIKIGLPDTSNENRHTFANRFSTILATKNWDLATLNAKIQDLGLEPTVKVTSTQATQYESGSVVPHAYRLQVLATAFEVNAQWLLGFDVPMTPTTHTTTNLLLARCRELSIEKQKSLLTLLG